MIGLVSARAAMVALLLVGPGPGGQDAEAAYARMRALDDRFFPAEAGQEAANWARYVEARLALAESLFPNGTRFDDAIRRLEGEGFVIDIRQRGMGLPDGRIAGRTYELSRAPTSPCSGGASVQLSEIDGVIVEASIWSFGETVLGVSVC